ncbi:unnamed protein product [Moneuplotes crassus]|uniref:Uncharacterized protein n=1 Tax=Euplotes crassus TaxID=5936 RepID=A0AAD1XMW0_EUPCR|nr:unnamed protein product [Moneuplotes crassus]
MENLCESYDHFKTSMKEFLEKNPLTLYTFAAIGLGISTLKVCKSIRALYQYTLRPAKDLQTLYGNNWAVVTGATAGIGKGISFELVRRGMNVLIIARDQQKLLVTKKELEQFCEENRYENRKFDTLCFDFNTHYTPEKIKEFETLCKHIEKVSILVNNVGVGGYGKFGEMDDHKIHSLINVNITATTVVQKIFTPKLLNNGKSGVIFVGSCVNESPYPNLAVYSATKAFVLQFANSIAEEYKDKLDVTTIKTSDVKTNMNSGKLLFAIDPDQHARGALDKLGHDTESHGHYIHAYRYFLANSPISRHIVNYINQNRAIRAAKTQ